MTDHAHPIEPTHDVATDAHVHEHPGEGIYFTVFIVLGLLTLTELLVTYIPIFKVPLLLALAATKAWLVVQFYMHLRYDNKIFTWALLIPIAMALIIAIFIQPLATTVR